MRIYIASKYLKHKDINEFLYTSLKNEGFDVFLPQSINIDAISSTEMHQVAETCFDEIEKCDVLVVVNPFGYSVTSEIGYSIALKRSGSPKYIVLYMYTAEHAETIEREAMIAPYIDAKVDCVRELINYLKSKEAELN